MAKGGVYYFNVRDHGYTNGLLGVPGEHYLDFIRYYEEAEALEETLAQNGTARKMLTEQRNALQRAEEESRTVLLNKQNEAATAENARRAAEEKVKHLENHKAALDGEHTALMDAHRSDYTLASGLLFLLFGLVFMGADMGISYSVIAQNLGMKGWEGILLAVGLGGLSVMAKPLYDRIAEKRLHHRESRLEGRKAWFFAFGVLGLILIIACVSCFAFLRTEMMVMLNASTDTGVFDPTAVASAAPETSPESAIFGKWYTQAGMVAAATVFIIGGTICMSIAIPVLFRNSKRIGYRRRSARLGRALDTAHAELTPLQARASTTALEVANAEETLATTREKLEALPSADALEARRSELQASLLQARTQQKLAAYLDAKDRGTARRETLTDAEKLTASVLQSANEGSSEKSSGGSPERRRVRPFVAVRRMLTERMRRESGTSLATDTTLDIDLPSMMN